MSRIRHDFHVLSFLRTDRSTDPAHLARPSAGLLHLWEVEPETLLIVFALLLHRDEIEQLFERFVGKELAGFHESALMNELLAHCSRPCALAEHIEQRLDHCTKHIRARLRQCSLIELADWWADAKRLHNGRQLAAFCWGLATDPRWQVAELRRRVLTEVVIRALRFFTHKGTGEECSRKGGRDVR